MLHAARWKYKNSPKIRHLRTIAQLCRAISSQIRHISTIGKNLLNSNASSTCPHNMLNFGQLTAEIGSVVWGTPANFNGFRVLASLLQRRRSTDINTKLCTILAVSCAGILYIHFRRLLPANGILPAARFTLRPSLPFSCIVTARYSSNGRQLKFAAWYKE